MSPKKQPHVNIFNQVYSRIFLCAVLAWGFTSAWAQASPVSAQSELPTQTLEIGGKKITAEIADEPNECEAGLMFRKSLKENSGMLFVMAKAGPVGFWMRNTEIPLTIAYIDSKGSIVEMHDMKPFDETVIASRFSKISYALEMPQGWFVKNNIWPGERIQGLPAKAD